MKTIETEERKELRPDLKTLEPEKLKQLRPDLKTLESKRMKLTKTIHRGKIVYKNFEIFIEAFLPSNPRKNSRFSQF